MREEAPGIKPNPSNSSVLTVDPRAFSEHSFVIAESFDGDRLSSLYAYETSLPFHFHYSPWFVISPFGKSSLAPRTPPSPEVLLL